MRPRWHSTIKAITNTKSEADVAHEQAKQRLNDLFGGLKNSAELRQVGIELEKLGDRPFSTLPNVRFDMTDGNIQAVTFSPSGWDFNCNNLYLTETKKF